MHTAAIPCPRRRIDRSHQLAAEVAALYPNASWDELNLAYTLRHRRELRLEALLYLFLAVLAAVWSWGLYAVDAMALSWAVGALIIVPGRPSAGTMAPFIKRSRRRWSAAGRGAERRGRESARGPAFRRSSRLWIMKHTCAWRWSWRARPRRTARCPSAA